MNSMNPMQGNTAGMQIPGTDPATQQAFASPQVFPQMSPNAPRPNNGMFTPGQDEVVPEQEDDDEGQEPQIRKLLESVNIADSLDEDKLRDIGEQVGRGFLSDLQSREEWEKSLEEWLKLAVQIKEEKTYPWPKAANIKYPLLATAAMQFAARAYPSLVPSNGRVVNAIVIGKDPTGEKAQMAERTSIYVSYQLLHEQQGWEEDMDKLLIMLPVAGVMFKKTYWDKIKEQNCSRLVMPKNLVVNYWTKDLNNCERISEIIEISPRLLKERQNAGVFSDIDLGAAPMPAKSGPTPANDKTTPYTLIEQHTFLDLDDDGYEEPYIVTFHKETRKILRIVARFDEQGLKTDEKGKIIRIEPIQYYTKFGFIPNPDGSFYDIGFGTLLGPLNDSVNTIINQLLDAGTLNNLQGGFIGKGLRIRMGEQRFQPGEWKAVNATADDMRKQIMPLPTKEPSNVLFQLMGSLITSGKELASVAEIFVGKMPGQNTPATTTMATIEQGMKVFTAVYKRIYRSLAEEYQKLYRLNEVYLNPNTYAQILGTNVDPEDFKVEDYKVCPGADPTAISQTERLLKAQGLVEMLPLGVLDPVKVAMRLLDAQEQPNWQELIHPQVQQTGQPAQQPDPKILALQAQQQADQARFGLEQQKAAFDSQLKSHDQIFQQHMAAAKQAQDAQFKQADLEARAESDKQRLQAKIAGGAVSKVVELAQGQQEHVQNVVHKEREHRQTIVHNEQKAHQQREIAKSQANQSSKTGSKTSSHKK